MRQSKEILLIAISLEFTPVLLLRNPCAILKNILHVVAYAIQIAEIEIMETFHCLFFLFFNTIIYLILKRYLLYAFFKKILYVCLLVNIRVSPYCVAD